MDLMGHCDIGLEMVYISFRCGVETPGAHGNSLGWSFLDEDKSFYHLTTFVSSEIIACDLSRVWEDQWLRLPSILAQPTIYNAFCALGVSKLRHL